MVKRFECPRCGSGVRPNDEQCFRCGEILHEQSRPFTIPDVSMRPEMMARPQSVPVEHSTPQTPRPDADARTKALQRRERDLSERERAIDASVNQLEKDTRSLEDAIKRFEREDHEMREREEILKQRELTMSSLAERMEGALSELDGRPGAEAQVQQLRELSQDYSNRVSEERRRRKAELDAEIEERLSRLKTIQDLLATAQSIKPSSETIETHHPELFAQPDEMSEEELAAAIAAVGDAVRYQLNGGASVPAASIVATGDERLDHILGGGIPAGHVLIVNGPSGSMKSTLCYHILHNAAKTGGRSSLYFSLEQKRDSIIRQMERMGMPLDEVHDKMLVVDMVDLRKATENEPGDWRSILMRYVKNVREQMPFDLFVLDSLESFKGMAQFAFTREDMRDLFDWFRELNVSVLVITENSYDTLVQSVQGETYLADGVVELLMKEFDARVYRWLRCIKMRGMNNDTRYYAFYHNGHEFKFSLPLVDSGE